MAYGLGHYARARTVQRAQVVDHGGTFPQTYDALIGLPGIGPYTAAAISATGLIRRRHQTAMPNELCRPFTMITFLPAAKLRADGACKQHTRRSVQATKQAVMDGATICTLKRRTKKRTKTISTQLSLSR
jgi:A/G-specific adenine glycosylase